MFIKLKCLFVCITQLRNKNIIEVAVSNYMQLFQWLLIKQYKMRLKNLRIETSNECYGTTHVTNKNSNYYTYS